MGSPRAERVALITDAPEMVTYLTTSLRSRPSLERALVFAADHLADPIGGRLRRALWEVYVRRHANPEASFLALADDWGRWNLELKRAMHALVHGVRDGSREALDAALARARHVVFEGARRAWRDYAASLRGPTTALFALGVMLPLIIGSMLPLLSLGTFAPAAVVMREPSVGNPLPWILLLDVAFPVLTFVFAHRVSTRPPAAIPAPVRLPLRRLLLLGAVPPMAVTVLWIPHEFSILWAIGGATLLASCLFRAITRDAERQSRAAREVDDELPDALVQLGSRLREGRGLEETLAAVADSTTGTAVGGLLRGLQVAQRLGGRTLRESVTDLPHRRVRAAFRIVVDVASQDVEAAGRTALETADHLREMRAIEHDIRIQLRPTVDAMRATATVFAPIVLGVTASLYGLLAEAFASLAVLPMDPATFRAALAVYLLLSAAAMTHFTTRIAGEGAWKTLRTLARTLPVAYSVFLASFLVSRLAT